MPESKMTTKKSGSKGKWYTPALMHENEIGKRSTEVDLAKEVLEGNKEEEEKEEGMAPLFVYLA